MDLTVFPAHDANMKTRREILYQAASVAGLALASPLVTAATPWVRLPDEAGTLSDELERLTGEVEYITENIELIPAPRVAAALMATWANADSLHVRNGELVALKARTATLAGANCISLDQPADGHRWFTIAHISARLAHDPALISWAHARAALGGLYFGDRPKDIMVDVGLAQRHAVTDAEKGMAGAVQARLLAEMGQRSAAVAAAETAVTYAADRPGASPRPDGWSTGQAHGMAAHAMADYPVLLPAVEAHTRAALEALPAGAGLLRAHTRLSLAQVRARARQVEGAAVAILQALDELGGAVQPVHVTRARQIAGLSGYTGMAMQPVRERLATLTA